jgi:hypothetical protein
MRIKFLSSIVIIHILLNVKINNEMNSFHNKISCLKKKLLSLQNIEEIKKLINKTFKKIVFVDAFFIKI